MMHSNFLVMKIFKILKAFMDPLAATGQRTLYTLTGGIFTIASYLAGINFHRKGLPVFKIKEVIYA